MDFHNFNRKSIWKIAASVSVVLMLLTLGVSAASACPAKESPAYNYQYISTGDCTKTGCTGDCCDNCTGENCTGDCCDNCTDECGLTECTGDCCEDCQACTDNCGLTECNGDCCEDCANGSNQSTCNK